MLVKISAAMAAAGALVLAAGVAEAGDKRHRHGHHGHKHHHYHHYHHVPPGHVHVYHPAPVYVAPAPVYVAPPVYAVPSRPVVSFGAVIPLR